MKRYKRRILLGIMVCIIGVGVWLYFHFFVSTNAALRNAEAFSFRRMTIAQLADQGEYRFFYATNRRLADDDRPLADRFGNEREESIKFGYFDTQIEPTLGIGMIINPTEWFQNEEIQLRRTERMSESAFVEQLTGLVQKSPYRSVLVIVHGFREAFPSALRKTAFLGHVLDINSPVLLFDWPGNQGATPLGYRRARQVAEASGAELAQTLQLIIRDVQPDRLWVVANSMGGQVVADAFTALYQDPNFADLEPELENVVLTAPDIDADEFDNQFQPKISALTRNLTVYVSSNDRALLMSRIINRGRRRGESTLSPDQLDEAVKVAEMVEPDSDAIILVDVTPVNRTRNFHNFSLETPEFFDDLYLRLINTSTPQSRLLYQTRTRDGTVYWVLTKGR